GRPRAQRAGVIQRRAAIRRASHKSVWAGKEPFALIAVREAGEYNSSHIPGASLIARRQLEYQVPLAVPFKGTPIVVCDDDGRRARLAAATLERLGHPPGAGARRGGKPLGHPRPQDRVGDEGPHTGVSAK